MADKVDAFREGKITNSQFKSATSKASIAALMTSNTWLQEEGMQNVNLPESWKLSEAPTSHSRSRQASSRQHSEFLGISLTSLYAILSGSFLVIGFSMLVGCWAGHNSGKRAAACQVTAKSVGGSLQNGFNSRLKKRENVRNSSHDSQYIEAVWQNRQHLSSGLRTCNSRGNLTDST